MKKKKTNSTLKIKINVHDRQHCTYRDGVIFSTDMKTLLHYPPNKTEYTYEIPEEVEEIASYAFNGVQNLTNLFSNGKLKRFNLYAINHCIELRNLTIREQFFTMEENAIYDCPNLKRFNIENLTSYKKKADGAIYKTNLQTNKTILIFYSAPANHFFLKVKENVTSISRYAYMNMSNLHQLEIPEGCIFENPDYKEYLKNVTISYYSVQTTEVSAPKKIQEIGIQKAPSTHHQTIYEVLDNNFCRMTDVNFKEIHNKGTIQFPSYTDNNEYKIIELGANVFDVLVSSKYLIKKILFPFYLETVDFKKLRQLTNLSTISGMNYGQYKIRNNMIECKKTKSLWYCPQDYENKTIHLDSSYQNLESNCFYCNKHMTTLEIRGNMVNIKSRAFKNCKNLRTIYFNDHVNRIEANAFEGMNQPLELIFRKTLKSIDTNFLMGFNSTLTVRIKDTTLFSSVDLTNRKKIHVYTTETGDISHQINTAPTPSDNISYLPVNSIVVVQNKFKCMSRKHHLEERNVLLRLISPKKEFKDVALKVSYCMECRQYYMYSTLFANSIASYVLRNGWKIIGANFKLPDGRNIGSSFTRINGGLEESILKYCGYTVGYHHGLPEHERMQILVGIIQKKLLSKQEVLSYLNHFIHTREKMANMEIAIADWTHDAIALNKMNI